jgi:hypothetical protein
MRNSSPPKPSRYGYGWSILSRRKIKTRLDLLTNAQLDGTIFYCFGMAADRHFAWLKDALEC